MASFKRRIGAILHLKRFWATMAIVWLLSAMTSFFLPAHTLESALLALLTPTPTSAPLGTPTPSPDADPWLALTTAPLPTSDSVKYDRPLWQFPGAVLAPTTPDSPGLKAGALVGTNGQAAVYRVDFGASSQIVGAFGRPTYDDGAKRNVDCQGSETYCVKLASPDDKNSTTDEFFGALNARGRPATVLHRIWSNGGKRWWVYWYDLDADTSYRLDVGTDIRNSGDPSSENAALAARAAGMAADLIDPYSGTVEGITVWRDLGDRTIASSDRAALRRVVNGLGRQNLALGALTTAPEAAAYAASTRQWAFVLYVGSAQAYWDIWQQNFQAAIVSGNRNALETALTEALAEQTMMKSLTPASGFADFYNQALATLAGRIAAAQQILAQPASSASPQTVWGQTPVFPTMTGMPIDSGLLPVPQEFQVNGPQPGQTFYNAPPNRGAWNAARLSGPSCGAYPSGYGGTRVTRWYGGCFKPPAAGKLPQLQIPGVAPEAQPDAPPAGPGAGAAVQTPTATATATRVSSTSMSVPETATPAPPTTRVPPTATPAPTARPTFTPVPTATPDPSRQWVGDWRGQYSGSSSETLAYHGAVQGQCSISPKDAVHISLYPDPSTAGNWILQTNWGYGPQAYVPSAGVCKSYYLTGDVTYQGPVSGSGSQLVIQRTVSLGRANPQSVANWTLTLNLTGPGQIQGTLQHSFHDFDGIYDTTGKTSLSFTLARTAN